MADIASSDVTYSEVSAYIGNGGHKTVIADVAFGDGALTYPAGGVPLDLGQLGFRNEILSMNLSDAANANGFVYKFDSGNNKIRIYQGDYDLGADGPLLELVGGAATPAAATLRVEAVGN